MPELTIEEWIELKKDYFGMWKALFPENHNFFTVLHLLLLLYENPNRYYHNLRHVFAGIEMIKKHKAEIMNYGNTDINLIRLAWWFHDSVYYPWRIDNEKESADLAKHILFSIGLENLQVSRVLGMIHATAHHQEFLVPTEETDIIRDVDLVHLAATPSELEEIDKNIWEECKGYVAYINFKQKRHGFLISLLKQPSIYETSIFKDAYEETAQKNIKHLLDRKYTESKPD